MREIKFRAWDKKYNKMYSDSDILCIYQRVGTLEVLERKETIGFDEVELMQYTGLKDKNGVEIFEGDILRKEGCWDIRVEYEKGVLWVRDLDKVRYNNKILNTPIAFFSIEEFEIIGNIHENSNLLKEERE